VLTARLLLTRHADKPQQKGMVGGEAQPSKKPQQPYAAAGLSPASRELLSSKLKEQKGLTPPTQKQEPKEETAGPGGC
jgi:hypothetical protein